MVSRISIILPVYNQGDHIEEIIRQYQAALIGVSKEIEYVLVINNSRDNSLEVCRKLAAKDKNIVVVHSEKGGWGLAVRLGLQAATGDMICYTNSARTSPQDLQLCVLYSIANPNVVIKANRKIRESFTRRMGSLLYNLECRNLFNLPYWDINGTPKIFPRHFEKLLQLEEQGDLIDLEFNVSCKRYDYPMIEVPILSTKRHGGSSTTNYGSAFKMYRGAFQMWRNKRDRD